MINAYPIGSEGWHEMTTTYKCFKPFYVTAHRGPASSMDFATFDATLKPGVELFSTEMSRGCLKMQWHDISNIFKWIDELHVEIPSFVPSQKTAAILQHTFKHNSPGQSAPGFRQDLTPIRTESDDQSHREGTWPSVTWMCLDDILTCLLPHSQNVLCRFGQVESSQSNLVNVLWGPHPQWNGWDWPRWANDENDSKQRKQKLI